MTDLEQIQGELRAALLHINGLLNNPDTAKSFIAISSLRTAKTAADRSLASIQWLIEWEANNVHDKTKAQ